MIYKKQLWNNFQLFVIEQKSYRVDRKYGIRNENLFIR